MVRSDSHPNATKSNGLATVGIPRESRELDEVTRLGAAELARRIADGSLTSVEVVRAFIDRCEQLQPTLNAVVAPRYEEALREAADADARRDKDRLLPLLHGVPITIKDCLDVVGLPTTLGLPSRRHHRAEADAVVVQRLRKAGAIILGKTNVPQAMLFHECDNPLYGLTPHPETNLRTCGGSSGGEAAIIAAGGSPLGCGTDLGGSIRVPAHFCGIHGLKPTSGRIPTDGVLRNLGGMHAIPLVVGPMGKRIEDLVLAYQIMANPPILQPTTQGHDYRAELATISLRGMRIGKWSDDGYFCPSPAIRRAVDEAASRLAERGAEIVEFRPPAMSEMMQLYTAIMAADGAATLRRLLDGNPVDRRLQHLLRVAQIPNLLRFPLTFWLDRCGRHHEATLVRSARRANCDQYWQLCELTANYCRHFTVTWNSAGLDAALSPPIGLPAYRHGESIKLLAASGSTFLPNLLDLPAGVVATTRVRPDEECDRPASTDPVVRLAIKSERNSVGLPVGVQVIAPRMQELRVLALMMALEPSELPLPE